jgi:hypothetical protein
MTDGTRSNSKTPCKLSFRCGLLPRNRHRLSSRSVGRFHKSKPMKTLPELQTRGKLPARYASIVMPLVLSVLMTFVVSAISTPKAQSATSKSGARFCVRSRSRSLKVRMIFSPNRSHFGGSCACPTPAFLSTWPVAWATSWVVAFPTLPAFAGTTTGV